MIKVRDVSHKAPQDHKGQEIAHIELEGRLDSSNTKEAEVMIQNILKDRKNLCIMLDLQTLNYISTMGLRLVILLAKSCKEKSSRLMLLNANDNIIEVLGIAGFLPTIAQEGKSIFETVSEADKYLEEIESRSAGKKHTRTIVLV